MTFERRAAVTSEPALTFWRRPGGLAHSAHDMWVPCAVQCSAVRMRRRRRVALTINRRRRTFDPVFREPAQLHHCYFLLVEPRSYFYGPRYSLILMPSRQTVCCSAPLKLFDSVSPPVCIVCNWYLKECRTVRSGSFEFFPPWPVTCQVNASLGSFSEIATKAGLTLFIHVHVLNWPFEICCIALYFLCFNDKE